jgi:hypothetical protein
MEDFLVPGSLTRRQAGWRGKLPTLRQEEFLRDRGLWRPGLTRGEASALIGEAIEKERRPEGPANPATGPGAPPEIGTSRRAGSAGRSPYGDGPSRRGSRAACIMTTEAPTAAR